MSGGEYKPIRSGDPIGATAWLHADVPEQEGDDVQIHAELSDVDEVAVVLSVGPTEHDVLVHLSRVNAIALAGQLAWAATASQTEPPHGHGPDGNAS